MYRISTFHLALGLFLLVSTQLCAQIKLTYPVDRQVIQRDNNNQASVQIAGSYSVPLDKVEARFVPIQGGQPTSWSTVQTNPVNGQFTGSLTAVGGWYQIEVRGKLADQIIGTDQLAHFGIGEVFIIFGHSNAQGSTCNGNNDCASLGGSTDERVVSVPINTNTTTNPAFGQYLTTADPKYLPGLTFAQWTATSGAAPFHEIPWIWCKMGDLLVQRLNVPVLFYGAGFGGTNMQYAYLAMNNQYFDHGFVNWSIQMPYANVRNIMNLYVPSTGVRGILVIHGENDRYTNQEDIRTYNREVMKQFRTKFSKTNLAWVLSTSSYFGERFDNVRNAQAQAIADINSDPTQSKVFAGPDLDPPAGTTGAIPYRPDGGHYSTAGQVYYAQIWADNLTADNNAFFRNSIPYPAEQQPAATIQCAADFEVTLSQPTGYSAYTWNTGNTNRQYQVGAGTYSAKLQRSDMSTATTRDAMRFYFPPAITIANNRIIPETPTINASSLLSCGSSLTLTSSYSGPAVWNTGATTQAISVTASGMYSVTAVNPLYSCASPAAGTVTVATGSADISLSSQVSRRLAKVGDTLRVTINVQNAGPCDVVGVQIQDRLPDNLTIVSAETGLVNSGTLISATLPLLANAGSLSRSYDVRVNAPGTYINALQVTGSPVADPDSQPNSGTGDGQDDMAISDFRTITTAESSTAVYVSPNPNQTPLPIVKSSQPAPVVGKADLSLAMQTSIRVLQAGQAVTVNLIISNVGGLSATNVGIQAVLPASMTFISSVSGLTIANGIVQGTIPSVAVGGIITLSFTAKTSLLPNQTLSIAGQISSADQADPDSTPGNGSLKKGEDDEATADLRVGSSG